MVPELAARYGGRGFDWDEDFENRINSLTDPRVVLTQVEGSADTDSETEWRQIFADLPMFIFPDWDHAARFRDAAESMFPDQWFDLIYTMPYGYQHRLTWSVSIPFCSPRCECSYATP